MMTSDHNEVEEEDMKTKLSMDSTKLPTTKRPYTDSEDEQDIPTKKLCYSSNKESETLKENIEIISDKNGIDENNTTEENTATFLQNKPDLDKNSLLNINVKEKSEESQDKLINKSEVQNFSKDDNLAVDESPAKNKEVTTSEVII